MIIILEEEMFLLGSITEKTNYNAADVDGNRQLQFSMMNHTRKLLWMQMNKGNPKKQVNYKTGLNSTFGVTYPKLAGCFICQDMIKMQRNSD